MSYLDCIVQILQLKFPTELPMEFQETEHAESLKNFKFPKIPQEILDCFPFDPNAESLKSILQIADFEFPTDFVLLDFFLNFETNSQDGEKYKADFILCSFVSWMLLDEQDEDYQHARLFFKCMLSLYLKKPIAILYDLCICSYDIYAKRSGFDFEKSLDVIQHLVSAENNSRENQILIIGIAIEIDKLGNEIFTDKFFQLLSDNIKNWTYKMNAKISFSLIQIIKRGVFELKKQYLNFFGAIANNLFIESDEIKVVIPMGLVVYTKENNIFNFTDENDISYPMSTPNLKPQVKLCEPKETYFTEEIHPLVRFSYEYNETFQELISLTSSLLEKLVSVDFILDIFEKSSTTKEYSHNHHIMLSSTFISILSQRKFHQKQWNYYIEVLCKSYLFSIQPSSPLIRELMIRSLLDVAPTRTDKFIDLFIAAKEYSTKQLIFRLIIENTQQQELNNVNFINEFVSMCVYYQQPEVLKLAESKDAISSQIQFMIYISSDEVTANFWFTSLEFNTLIIYFMSDEKIRPSTIGMYIAVMANSNSVFPTAFTCSLSSIFEIASSTLNENAIQVADDVLKAIILSIRDRKNLAHLLSNVIESLSKLCPRLQQAKIGTEFIITVLEMLDIVSEVTQIDERILTQIFRAAAAVEDNYDQIQTRLWEAAAFKCKFVVIKNPTILLMYLMRLKTDEELIKTYRILKEACLGSLFNVSQIRDHHIDEHIMQTLGDLRAEGRERSALVHETFKLLEVVHSTSATPTALLRYISLMCPGEGRWISPFLGDTLLHFSGILSLSFAKPAHYATIQHGKSQIIVTPSSTSYLSNSFMFSIFMYIEGIGSVQHQTLMSITDPGKGQTINLVHSCDHVFLSIVSKDNEQVNTVPIPTSEGTWDWYTISAQYNDGTLTVQLFVSSKSTDKVTTPFKKFRNAHIVFHMPDAYSDIPFGYIAAFGIYNYGDSLPYSIAFKESVKREMERSKAFMYFQKSNKSLAPKCRNMHVRLIGDSLCKTNAIADVLDNVLGIKTVLIPFAEINLPFPDGTISNTTVLDATGMLMVLLQSHPPFEVSFCEANGPEILGHLLLMSDEANITFALFNRLLSLTTEVKYEPLKEKMLLNVILSMGIWRRTDTASFSKIVRALCGKTMRENPKTYMKGFPIPLIFMEIKWVYTLDDKMKHLIRTDFNTIASFIVGLDPSPYNFSCAIAESLTANTTELTAQAMILLQTFFSNKNINIDAIKDYGKYLFMLNKHLNKSEPVLFILLLDIICASHEHGLLNVKLSVHLEVVARLVPQSMLTEGCVNMLINKIEEWPQLVTFVAQMARRSGQIGIDSFASGVRLSNNAKNIHDLLSIINIFSLAHPSHAKKLIEHLLKYNPTRVYILLLINMELGGLPLGSLYAARVIDSINNSDDADLILPIVFHDLVFTSATRIRRHTYQMLQDSPFEIKNTEKNHQTLDDDIIALSKRYIEFLPYQIVTDTNKWDKEEVAVKALKLLIKYPHSSLMPLAVLTASMLIRINNPEVGELIKKLKPAPWQTSPLQLAAHNEESYKIGITRALQFIEGVEVILEEELEIVMDDLATKIKTVEQNADELMGINAEDVFANGYLGSLSRLLTRCQFRNTDHKNMWKKLWHEMTQDHAPWEQALPPGIVNGSHMMRDDIICHGSPLKQKRNLNFNDHLMASFHRDLGSEKAAMEKVMQHRIKLQESVRDSMFTSSYTVFEKKAAPVEAVSGKQFECIVIQSTGSSNCELVIGSKKLRLTGSNIEAVFTSENVSKIYLRLYLHRPNSIEIFDKFGCATFIHFPDVPLNEVFKALEKVIPNNALVNLHPRQIIETAHEPHLWVTGKMTNFEYLLYLNQVSGRTFNDPAQYPLMPWVICDYKSDILDLSNPKIFRDLTKPVGALNEERLAHLKVRSIDSANGFYRPFLYQCGPICAFQVYYYLIRQEPFTSLHIQFQGGKFDQTARIFKSIELSYNHSTSQTNSFYELIPEFFCMPEFLRNVEGYNLGTGDNGDVKLPPWASSPEAFVYLNRKALESGFVTRSIHNWIDLIWGYKQSGEEAEKADNTFEFSMYEETWNYDFDETTIMQIETMKKEVGQIPPQLFTRPHPSRQAVPREALFMTTFKVSIERASPAVISTSVSGNEENILCINTDGSIIKIKINSEGKTKIEEVNLSINASFAICPDSSRIAWVPDEGNMLAVNNAKRGAGFRSQTLSSEIACIASDRTYCMACCVDSQCHVWKLKTLASEEFSVTTYGEEPTCCAIDSSFDLVVIGTHNSSIHFVSIKQRTGVRVVDTPAPVEAVYISPGWGFVLAQLAPSGMQLDKSTFVLYNVNGTEIGRLSLDCDVTAVTIWRDDKGFDYAAYATEYGDIFAFELFFMNPTAPLVRMSPPPCVLRYSDSMLHAVTKRGLFYMIPI